MADMKTTIIKTLAKGKETLQEIDVLRKHGTDYRFTPQETEHCISKLHQNLKLKVAETYLNTKDALTIRFVSANNEPLPAFQSGQYINIFTLIDGVYTSRPYSLSSPCNQRGYYEITVARINGGFVSDYLIDQVKVNDEFRANGPAGSFYYNPVFHFKKNVFIAGGSGITPFISMIKEVLEKGSDREIHLIYGCRDQEHVIFQKELAEYQKNFKNFTYDLVLSEPQENWQGLRGFLTKELIETLVSDLHHSTYYLCGPQVMNNCVEEILHSLAIRPAMIRREMFSNNQHIEKEQGYPENFDFEQEFTIKVKAQQETHLIKAKANESILIALERNQIRVNVCCRSGECSLCRVQLVKGNVYLAKGILQRKADQKYGYIHSCKAYPLSDLEIIL